MARALLLLLAVLLGPALASGQVDPLGPQLGRPSERPFAPDVEPLRAGTEEADADVPSPIDQGAGAPLSFAGSVAVDALRLTGNRAIDDATLIEAARPFLGRRLSPEDLQALAVALTRVYVERGYVNSGATIPDQRVEAGVLEVAVVEGRLREVRVEGVRRYRGRVIEERLMHSIGAPLRASDVEDALRTLERERTIRRVAARLRPTEQRGEARLVVVIDEEPPFWVGFATDNYEPPSVGSATGRLAIGHDNPLGLGDRFVADGTFTEGLMRLDLSYEVPVLPIGTSVGVGARISDATVVEPPFDVLDIESRVYSVGISIGHPIRRSPSQDLRVGLMTEYRYGRTGLLGRDFSFTPGLDEARVQLVILRPIIEWTLRRGDFALALRSINSVGLGVPDLASSGAAAPSNRFIAWLGQARGVYRSGARGIEVHGRLDFQLASAPLLPLEQFALGGPGTVRGYPRNWIVRDQAVVGGLELRLPVWTRLGGRRVVQLGAFVDAGHGWNRDRETLGPRTLVGVGAGLHLSPYRGVFLDFEYAAALCGDPRSETLQSKGILLSARWLIR